MTILENMILTTYLPLSVSFTYLYVFTILISILYLCSEVRGAPLCGLCSWAGLLAVLLSQVKLLVGFCNHLWLDKFIGYVPP